MFKFLLSASVLATTAAVGVTPLHSPDMSALRAKADRIMEDSLDALSSGAYVETAAPAQRMTLEDEDEEASYIVFSSYTDAGCDDPDGIYYHAGTKLSTCESYSNETYPDWHSYSISCANDDTPPNASFYALVFDFYESDDCTGPVNFTAPTTSPSTCDADTSAGTYLLLFTKASCERSDAPWEDEKEGITQL